MALLEGRGREPQVEVHDDPYTMIRKETLAELILLSSRTLLCASGSCLEDARGRFKTFRWLRNASLGNGRLKTALVPRQH